MQDDSILKIGIVGQGKMGTNLFYYLLDFGLIIRWLCSSSADLEKLRKNFSKKMTRSRDAGIITENIFQKLMVNTLISGDIKILADCDLVIEAIPENIVLKRDLFKALDSVINGECLIASNSSSINPGRLIPSPRRSSHFFGLHFFYPVSLRNIVEIIVPGSFSNPSLTRVITLLDKINRNYIILDEENSFVLNKIFLDFQNEAFLMVQNEHITFGQVDAIIREHFFPIGAFEFFDSVGIDTMLVSIKNYTENYPHKDYYYPLISQLEEMVKQKYLGQKSSRGFYQYSSGEIIHDIPDSDLIPTFQNQIVEHLRYTYLTTVKRFTSHSGLSIQEMNDAIKEYFNIEKGPYEF